MATTLGLVNPTEVLLDFVNERSGAPEVQTYEEFQAVIRGEHPMPRSLASFIISKADGEQTPWGTSLVIGNTDHHQIVGEVSYRDEMPCSVGVSTFEKRRLGLLTAKPGLKIGFVLDDPRWDLASSRSQHVEYEPAKQQTATHLNGFLGITTEAISQLVASNPKPRR